MTMMTETRCSGQPNAEEKLELALDEIASLNAEIARANLELRAKQKERDRL